MCQLQLLLLVLLLCQCHALLFALDICVNKRLLQLTVCFGVSNPLKNIAPSFLPSPHLNIQTIQAPFPTGTPRQIDVNLTFILRRYVEDQISTNFHVISAYFFDGNFADRKIHVVSKFLWYNFADQKIHVVSTNFFRCNFSSRDTHGASTYSF